MFVQVFQGQISDAEQIRRAAEDWVQRLAPGADGWPGSTIGVTDDGYLEARAGEQGEMPAEAAEVLREAIGSASPNGR